MRWIRSLYDWVLGWAGSRYGALALFALAFAESMVFPVPPDALLVALVLGSLPAAAAAEDTRMGPRTSPHPGSWRRPCMFALLCTTGSLLGGLGGYGLGRYAWLTDGGFTELAHFFFDTVPGISVGAYEAVGAQFDAWGFEIIFAAGFTPIPYKVFTISAGAFDVDLMRFLTASLISRGARFFLVATLIWWFGAPIQRFIDRYFNLLTALFTVLLVGGFVVVKLLL